MTTAECMAAQSGGADDMPEFSIADKQRWADELREHFEEHNATMRREARFAEIGNSLAGAIEQAAGQLSELGLTGDEVGEFIADTWQCSKWDESLHIDGCTLPGDHEGACDV